MLLRARQADIVHNSLRSLLCTEHLPCAEHRPGMLTPVPTDWALLSRQLRKQTGEPVSGSGPSWATY